MHSSVTMPLDGTMAQDSEGELVLAAQAHPAAFAPLYLRYRDRIYAYLRTRTWNAEDAADLTQQVFLQALDALPRYRSSRVPFAAWLLRIAHNIAANYHKRHRPSLAWDCIPEALQPTAGDDLDAELVHREAIAQLEIVLRNCSAGTREVLALHYAARLTIAETAAVIGKSEAAVKKQLTRAIRALKEEYHDSRR